MSDTFRIVLQDVNDYDTYKTREFDLPLNAVFPIGRASKNATKTELMPAPHNAYIDSPVISREHAVLSANASSGTPHVYISDSGSMHGTMINGRRLVPNAPEQLAAGDLLQFGVDVNRNEEYFLARKYTFDSRLSRPFSLGFTVPDPESEEEHLDIEERRGSQLNPLMIDDSESESESEQSHDDQPEATVIEEVIVQHEERIAAAETHPLYEEYPESAMRSTILEDRYSDEEAGLEYSSESEEEDVLDADVDSEVASAGSSEPDYSEPEVPDSEEEDLDHYKTTSSVTMSMTPMPQLSMTSLPTVQPRDIFSVEEISSNHAPELPSLGVFTQHFDSNPFADSIAPPLPPRPSAPRPAPWNTSGFTSFGQQNDSQAWYSDDMPAQPNYLGTNFGDRPSLFSPAPLPPAPESSDTRGKTLFFSGGLGSIQQAERLQTPPSVPIADVTTSTSLQPNRRTKVSIEEIVEDQPPTPTSLNSMKRKADVLEEEENPVVMETVIQEDVTDAVVVQAAADTAAQTAAIVAARPKKQPRSILGKVLNAASYPLLGAAGAVASFAVLSSLPDTFFV